MSNTLALGQTRLRFAKWYLIAILIAFVIGAVAGVVAAPKSFPQPTPTSQITSTGMDAVLSSANYVSVLGEPRRMGLELKLL